VKIYNLVGYAIIVTYGLGCVWLSPPAMGPWAALLVGAVYFVAVWFMGGLYLSSVIHLGIAHRALDYKEWFIKAITVVNNTLGVYINPTTWVNRHRLHHRFSDHAGDPNKLSSDGFWRTLVLCLLPYPCEANVATDAIFKSWSFRLVSHPVFAALSQAFNFCLLWVLVKDVRFAAWIWIVFRVFALWINMVQNYWAHEPRFGYRRYDDERDQAMNIGEWLPVTVTFSACLQNNHHHAPSFMRLSHEEWEYDFGFMTVKAMKALGLVRATSKGATLPHDIPLKSVAL